MDTFYMITFIWMDRMDTKKFATYDELYKFYLFLKKYDGKVICIRNECGNPLFNNDLI